MANFFRKMMAVASAAVLLGTFLTGCSSSTGSSKSEIKIGLVSAISGGSAMYGQQMKNGALLAVGEINKSGGILGKQVKLIIEDDKGSPQEAVKGTQKLVSQDQIDVWVGTANSSSTLAALEVTGQAKVPSLVPFATADKITQTGAKNVFRNCANNPMQVKAVADYITQNLPQRRFAIVAENTDYGRGLAQNFQADVSSGGGTVLTTEYYKPGDKDFYNQLTKIKNLNPEGMLIAGLIAEGSQIAAQSRELGIKAQFYAFGGFMGEQAVKLTGDAGNGLIHSDYFSPVGGDPTVDKFISGYKTMFNTTPDTYASAGTYDAIYIAKAAIEKAGGTDHDKVNQALSQTKDFQGVMGKVNFDQSGQAQMKVWITQIQNGKQVVIYKP